MTGRFFSVIMKGSGVKEAIARELGLKINKDGVLINAQGLQVGEIDRMNDLNLFEEAGPDVISLAEKSNRLISF